MTQNLDVSEGTGKQLSTDTAALADRDLARVLVALLELVYGNAYDRVQMIGPATDHAVKFESGHKGGHKIPPSRV